MRKKLYNSLIITSILLVLIFATPAKAQEAAEPIADNTTTVSVEAVQDTTVIEADLDATTPGPFNFLKRIVRSIQQVITTDPIKKADLNLKTAHEELLRAQKIVNDNPDNNQTSVKVEKALEKFQENINKVKERATDIKNGNTEQAQKFLEKIANIQVKQQKIMDNLESNSQANNFKAIKEARRIALESGAETMTNIANSPEQLGEAVDSAMVNQVGSEFKEFKNLEVLQRLSELVPQQARPAIMEAQKRAKMRFEERMSQISPEDRTIKFENYISDLNGNALNQVNTLDNLKTQTNLPDDFFQHVEAAKAQAIIKFAQRLREASSDGAQKELMDQVANGDLNGLRVLQQVKDNIPAELRQQIEIKQTDAINKFKEKFTDNQDAQDAARKFQGLSEEFRNNPDPTAFAVLQSLQKQLPPEQQAFVNNLRREATNGAVEQYRQNPQQYLQRSQSINPAAVQDIQGIIQQAPQLQYIFQQVSSQQTNFTKQQLDNVTDPVQFKALQEKLENNPAIARQIQARFGNLQQNLQTKFDQIEDMKNQPQFQNLDEMRRQIEMKMQQNNNQQKLEPKEFNNPPFPRNDNQNNQPDRPNVPLKVTPQAIQQSEIKNNQVNPEIKENVLNSVPQQIRQINPEIEKAEFVQEPPRTNFNQPTNNQPQQDFNQIQLAPQQINTYIPSQGENFPSGQLEPPKEL